MKKSKGFDPDAEAAAELKAQKQPANGAAAGKVETEDRKGDAADDMESQTDAMAALQEILAAKEKDFEALTDKYLRLAAEYDNFRRRSQKEKEALYTDSIALVVKEMLPVIDNLERAGLAAVQYENEDARKIADGIAMIQKQAEQALTRLGVCRIACEGQPFDPELHEAVMHVEDDSFGPSTVVAELQSGYRRDDRVIRHSMVKVAN
jgi:molecular chaperone GrpE